MNTMNIVVLLTIMLVPIASATTFWDMVPLVSQLKALVQGLSGDFKAGDETTINFIKDGFVTSQFRSLYYLLTGDFDTAYSIQKKFGENLEPIFDSVPILGHVKGAVHLATGDAERGWKAIKQATTTTGSVAGAVLGGPLGAVAGHVVTDGAISIADWMINGDNAQPHGVVDYALTLGDRKAGEHFDALAGILMNGITGSVQPLKKNGQGSKMETATSTQSSNTTLHITQPSVTANNPIVGQPSNTTLLVDRNAGDRFDVVGRIRTNGVQPFENNDQPPVEPTVILPSSTSTLVVNQSSNTFTSTVTGPSDITSTVDQPSNTTLAVTQSSSTTLAITMPSSTTSSQVKSAIEQSVNTSIVTQLSNPTLMVTRLIGAVSTVEQLSNITSTVIEQSINTLTVAQTSNPTLIVTQPTDATLTVEQPSSTTSTVIEQSINTSTVSQTSNPTLIVTQPTDATLTVEQPSSTTSTVIEQSINTSTVSQTSNPTLIVTQPTEATSTVGQPSSTTPTVIKQFIYTSTVTQTSNPTLIVTQPTDATLPVVQPSSTTLAVTLPSSTTFAVTQQSNTTPTVIQQSINESSTVTQSLDTTLIVTQPIDATSVEQPRSNTIPDDADSINAVDPYPYVNYYSKLLI